MMENDEGPISLETRMAFVLAVYFLGLFGLASVVGSLLDVGSMWIYLLFALVFITLQNLAGAALFASRLRVRWLSQEEAPRLYEIANRFADAAGVSAPRIGSSRINAANAFTFGRTHKDGRICITQQLLEAANDDELSAVVAHEISHIKSWDANIVSLLTVVPVLSQTLLELPQNLLSVTGWLGARLLLIALAVVVQPVVWLVWLALMPVNWFSTVLLNYACRVRELAADREAVRLGIRPCQLASALYKISLADADLSEAFHLKTTRPLLIGRRYETYGDKVFLRRLDADTSGDINELELDFLRNTQSKATLQERVAELFSPHPLLRDRFARLARLA